MHSHSVAVVGAGYVGLTTAACLASLGHRVVCGDSDREKLAALRRAEVGILEPGLAELVAEGVESGRLVFVEGAAAAVADGGSGGTEAGGAADGRTESGRTEAVFLCLPTPMGAGGTADLSAVFAVAAEIRDVLPRGCAVVNKSTVPVGSAARVSEALGRADCPVVSNPEFLREGSAVADFLHPDRIVVGSADRGAAERIAALYAPLDAPVLLTDAASAELVKYAANCFLATKLSYVNAVAELCERVGADIRDVADGMGRDPRIGSDFLAPGPGWGGSCLPKDTRALQRVAAAADFDFGLLDAVVAGNERQPARVADRVAGLCGVRDPAELTGLRLGLLGLTFKAGTNDLRDSPALAVARELTGRGAELAAYDPALTPGAPGAPGAADAPVPAQVAVLDDAYAAAKGADALLVLTEWPQFRELDWARMAAALHGRVVLDTRNHLEPAAVSRAGLAWHGFGRPAAYPEGADGTGGSDVTGRELPGHTDDSAAGGGPSTDQRPTIER